MASGDKEAFPVAGVIQSSSRIIISQQSPSPSPGASKPQSYKVFVLPPSQLNSLGLVAKNENGRVILTERAIESAVAHNAAPNSNAAMSLAFIKTPEGIQIQSGQSSSSVKTTPKRGYVASAEVMKGGVRELQVHRPVTKISTPGTNALGASPSRPMFARRSSSRRLLPQFTNYWKSSLEEKGYIRCPLRGCNYICLNFGEMTIHYYQCKGEPFASKYVCTPCNGRLKSEEDLKSHYIQTHSREGRIARKPPPKKVVELPKPEEKTQVWIRKRAYSKVHKISWNIALEEKGYVNCFFKNCCFMALDLNQMIKHYGICNGTTAATSVECPYCEACAECLEKLEAHVKKAHAGNPSVSQVVNPEVNIAVSVSDSLPVPVPQTNIASAVSSGINIGSSFVHQEKETVILSKKQSRPAPIKISAPTDKTMHTVVSMTDKLPKSLDQPHSRLYCSDTISKTSGSLSSSADTEVHCLFSMYEDFDEQRNLEREVLLDSHLSSVGLSVKRDCENTSTVLCKTYSKDNQRLVKDESYNERISSPLSALPCSFSDNISLCTDLSDIQIMRSSMSEGANNVMLVETKPEACVVEKLHEYMSHCDSDILNEENVSFCGMSLNPKEQKEISAKLSVSQSSNPVSQESNVPHYELFNDDEPDYPQEYSLNSSINKTVKSDDINLSQNDLEESKQVTVEECLFAESYASSSLVSYTEDVEEYIIPEIIEMTQYVVESPVEVCSKAVNKRIQKPNEKRKITSSQVPTNRIEHFVPAKANISNVCKNKENTNNNIAGAKIDRPRSIHPIDSVKYAEPQAHNILQKKVHSDIQVTSQDHSSAVETSFTDIQSAHPLYADSDDLQNLDVPILASVSVSKDNMLNSNNQFVDVQHAESDLSEVNQELYLKKSVGRSLIISDTDKLTNSVESENIEILEKKNLTETESPDTAIKQFVPEDLCNTGLICGVNIKSENDVHMDVALNDNVLENVTEGSSTENQLSEISSLDIPGEETNNSIEQCTLKHKKKLSEITINLLVSETSDQDLRDVKGKENALEVEHSSLKTLPQAHSILDEVCSDGVQCETKISEVLPNELEEPLEETTLQTVSHANSSNISQLTLSNSVPNQAHDESVYSDVECRIDEFHHESNQTLMSYNSILPSHNLKQDSQTSSESSTIDKVLLDKTLQPATEVPEVSDSTKEGICIVANAKLNEKSSQIKEQTLKLVSSEAASEFSHFHEMKNTDCNSVPLGEALGDIQLHLDTNEKEIVRINSSNCEGLSYENESKSTKLTGLHSNVSSISVLKEEIELKIDENKSSYVELSRDGEHSVPVVVSVEELESNVKASEAKLPSVSFTNIEVERKDDHLHLCNMFSETSVSKDVPLSSQGGLLSTVSESNAVISANSNVGTAIKSLPDKNICYSLGNLPEDIESASTEDNQLESSSMAVNDLIVCIEQKNNIVKESIPQGKDKTFQIEKEDTSINISKISGVFPSSQCVLSGDPSKIVSTSLKEVTVEKITNIENDERIVVVSQILEHSDTLVDENQEVDSSNVKKLDSDLITTIAENVQEVNQLYPPSEAPDSDNKVDVLPITVPLISVTLESDNQSDGKVDMVECSSMDYVSKTTEENTFNEKFSQNELPLKGMLDSKENIKENESQLVSEVIPQTQNVLQVSDCVAPFVEDPGPISNEKIHDFSSTEENNEKRVKKETENENNSISDYNASHIHLSTVSESNADKSNIEMVVKPLPDGNECDLGSLPRKIGNTCNVKPSDEDNQLDSPKINDNTLQSSTTNDWIPCLEEKNDNVEESFQEHKSDTFKLTNEDMSTSDSEVITELPESQSPLLKDPSQIISSSVKEITFDERANIKNDERSIVRSQVLEHSDILQNKSQEAGTSNLKMLDDLIVLDSIQEVNQLYPPCEVTDSVDKMKPNSIKLISGSSESDRHSNAEIEPNESTSLSDISKATEEKNSQIEIVSEGGLLLQGITDSKKDTRENETQLLYRVSPETQKTLQVSECVTPFVEDIPVSNREIHEFSSEEQMDVKIVGEETEDEKISISVDDASCSHLNTVSESNVLFTEKSNVATTVKPLYDDKKSDSLNNLSKEINNTFDIMLSDEGNQLETSRVAINDLSPCPEQKNDNAKESSLEEGKDITFKMESKDMSTDSSKNSGVLLDSQTPISEDPSKIVSASIKDVNIDKMTKIENVERSFVVSHALVDSDTPQDNNQEADSNNLKILDGDLITTVVDVQEVNELHSSTELPDSIDKTDVLPTKISLISESLESNNQSNEEVDPVESLSLSDVSQATEENNSPIKNVSERELFPKVIPDSKKGIGENETLLVHEVSPKTQNALEVSECVTPFVEDTKPESSREIHNFSSEEQMDVKIVTEELKDEKISITVDGASCLHMNIISESNELITENSNIVMSLKPLHDDKESDSFGNLPKEVNSTFNVMSSDEDNRLESSRMAINDLSPCSEQKYDSAKESSLESKGTSTNSSKISGVLSDSQIPISEDPSRIVSASIKEVNIDKMANIENAEKSVLASQVVVDSDTPQDNNQEADSRLKAVDGDLTTTVADDVQEINELRYFSSEFSNSINKMDVLPATVPLVSESIASNSHSNTQVDAVECTSLRDESKTTEELYSQIENIPESGLILKQTSDSKKDIKENETQLCEESPETQTASQISECVTPSEKDMTSGSSKKILEFENTKVVTNSTNTTEEQTDVKFVTEELEDKKFSITVDEVSFMTNTGKLKRETPLPCIGDKTMEGNALTSTDSFSDVKINENGADIQNLTVVRESSEAELIHKTDNVEKEVCVVKGITDVERTVANMKDNFLSASDEKCVMPSQKQDNVNIVVPILLPLKKPDDTVPSLKESSISEEPSIASECSLTGSPEIFQESGGYEKHVKPTSEVLESIKENESSISDDIQEVVAKEPSVLSCNVSIVADTKNITGFDFNAKSNVLEYIKDQKDVLNAKARLDKEIQEIIEYKNENKLSASLVPLTEKSESTKETTLGTEFSGTSLLETRTLLGREQNMLGDMSEQNMHSPTSNEAPLLSETTIALSENVKPLSLENLSIALAGEMEDRPEHASSHEMLGVDSYSNKAHSDNKKLLIPQEDFAKTFENYALDSPRTVSESDEKIYSTQDLQQILEGSDDSKHKMEDEETSICTLPRESVLSSNETDMLKREESDPSQLHIKKEIVTSSDSLKEIQKNFETDLTKINSSCDKDPSSRKRRHSSDFSIKMEIDGECENYSSPLKRKRSSSLCCDLTTNYEKSGKLRLLKTTLIKETMKSNEQLEKLESNANLTTSYSDNTEKQNFSEITNRNKLSNDEDIVRIKETSVNNSNLNKDSESKCVVDVSEDSMSNTNICQQKRKINDTIHLPLETNNIQVDAVTVACLEAKDRSFNPENKTELVCTEPPQKRRKRSIETREEAEVERKSRRQSLRIKTNLSEDSNSSNSSVSSACDIVDGRKTRRGRKSRKVDDNLSTSVNSESNTHQKENSEDATLKQTKTGNLGESETQQILPYDSEQSIMSEDSVFSKTDSQNEFDSSVDVDDSASSTVGSIISDDSKDWADDSQIGIDQESDMIEIGTNCQGQGRGGGRGQGRRRNYRRGSKRRVHWRRRGVQKVGEREEEEESQSSSLPVDSANSCVQAELTESNEIEQRREDPNEEIQCGKCKEKMKRKSYDRHNSSIHNGLSWLEGEQPFDMSNEKLILSILWKVVKTRRFLTCENCGESKKSAVGFWSHIAFCQRTAEEREALKVACEICGRYMIPASLKVHLQMHRVEPKPDPVPIETTRTQRAAAAKATSLLQEVMKEESQVEDKKTVRGSEEMVDLYQRLGPAKPSNSTLAKWKRLIAAEQQLECHFPGCTFKSADLEVMIQHFGKCEKCPRRVYSCDLCDFQTKNEKEMQHHLGKEHLGNLEESDPDDPKSLKKMQSKLSNWKVYNKLLFLGREMSGNANGDKPFLPAVKWTLKFMEENYAKEDLFPHYHTTTDDWIPVPESEYSQYLPQTKESISFSTLAMREEVVSTDSLTFNWRRMKIFESDIIDGVPTLFTGGPIWALAWATNPLTEIENDARDQFLAVSCHQQMGDTYKSNERYVGKGLIQLWNFGPLDNLQRSTSNPKFVLGIAHEYGSVWDLEWCPSGCYETSSTNEHLQRLGLLAAACSDGCVHIFSVCFTTSLANDARYPIFRCKPVMTLIASENLTCELGGLPWSCLRLSWYKGKDHSVVAGGFNNGMVSLWNIRTESLLLRKKENGTSILLPYKSFQAHLSCVTALSLSSQDEGRYLMTGSKDTTIKVWDMEDTSGPIPPVVRKGMVTDGIWLTHWLSSITSFDDVYSMGHCNTTLNPPRGYGFKLFPLLPQNSVTWSLSTTDWVNGIAQSTHAGELTVIFPHQLFLNVDTEKGNKDKRLILSYVELKDIVNETEKHKCESSCSVPCTKQQLGDIQMEIECNKSKNPSEYEKVMFQLEEKDESEKGGLSFVIERNPRKGKKCVITPLSEQIYDSTSASDSSCTNDNVNEGIDSLENIECVSMLNQHEKRLLFTFKKDLERLNVTSRLKVTFPYYNNEKKKSNSNDTVKEYLMIVGSVKDDIKTENCAEDSGGSAKAIQDDDSMFTIPSDDYEAVESKFGMIFCDFPADNLSTIPAASRLWTRKSETMKTAPVEIYPITSLNKVKWNPNCRSFLWLASGYQCGLLRIPCISGMHNKEVEQLLRHTTWQKV